jgi:hypothetical protein
VEGASWLTRRTINGSSAAGRYHLSTSLPPLKQPELTRSAYELHIVRQKDQLEPASKWSDHEHAACSEGQLLDDNNLKRWFGYFSKHGDQTRFLRLRHAPIKILYAMPYEKKNDSPPPFHPSPGGEVSGGPGAEAQCHHQRVQR